MEKKIVKVRINYYLIISIALGRKFNATSQIAYKLGKQNEYMQN